MTAQSQSESWLVIRYVILTIVFILLLGTFLIWRIDTPRIERLRLAVLNEIVPNVSFLTVPAKAIGRLLTDITAVTEVFQQNERLKKELTTMRKWREAALQLEQKNAKLRVLNNLKLSTAHLYVTGEIIADSGGPFSSSVLLNLGADDEIVDGAAVVDGLGLVGRISGVEDQLSRIILLADVKSFIPVIIGSNNIEGIVRGDNSSNPLLDFVRGSRKIQAGSRVYTSGRGGIFPAGILIGKTILSSDKQIRIQLAADLNQLDYVRVIINRKLKIPNQAGDVIRSQDLNE